MKSVLRPHQESALSKLKLSLGRGNRKPILRLPTGAGKTKLAAAITEGALNKGNRVVFTVPAISLINQTVESFLAEGITDIGVIQSDHVMTNPSMPVQIASVQTLQNRFLPDAEVVVFDEVHRFYQLYADWMAMEQFERTKFIGLSATPWTKGLGKHFDDLIIGATTQELIDAGYLSRFDVFCPSHPDLSGVKTVAGDYHEGQLADVMSDADLVADIVETWLKRGTGNKTLCFCVDRAHARKVQTQFHEVGISAGYVDANTSLEERETIAKNFHAGHVPVVVNVGCLTTGVDWDVRCLILARPTKSIMLFEQIIGRALRTAEGKERAIILDHSDTHLRLGMVTDINPNRLDDGKKREAGAGQERKEPLPKECPSCSFLKPAKVRECPHCGFVPERKSEVETADGELVQFSGGKVKGPTPEEKQDFYRKLLGYAHQKGKSDSWVQAKYRSKFNEWPYRKRGVTPLEPTQDVIGWIKHSNIKWAKSLKRGAA